MEIVNSTPLRLAPLVSLENPGEYTLSLILKGTFDLVADGQMTYAAEQTHVTGDQRYDDDDQQSLYYASDFVPRKPTADVMLVGKCHTPGGQPMKTCQAGFRVGQTRKSLQVFGDRFWTDENRLHAEISEAVPFVEMPLRYENSFGGSGSVQNPLGKGASPRQLESGQGGHPLPNIEDPNALITAKRDQPPPAGFAPIDQAWESRQAKIGTYDALWQQQRWPCPPLDFDASFYNAAPAGLQVGGFLQGAEEVELENIHPVSPHYVTRLPGMRVRCFVDQWLDDTREKTEFREITLNLDTLLVDADRDKSYLVWRGTMPVQSDDYSELAHVFVLVERLDEPAKSVPECEELFRSEQNAMLTEGKTDVQLPNVEQWIAKVEQRAAEMVAAGFAVDSVNRQLAGLGVQFPDLSSKSLEEQSEDLDAFATETLAAAETYGAAKKVTAAENFGGTEAELDSQVAAANQASEAQQVQLLKELGIDQDLQQLDIVLKQTAADLYRLGVDLGPGATAVAGLSEGLAGMGFGALGPGLTASEAPKATDRETVLQRLQQGESFQGALLSRIDLSGLDLRNADFREAILVDANLEGADLSGANLSGAVLTNASLAGARLVGASCAAADLGKAILTAAQLSGADLSGSLLEECQAEEANFDQVVASKARFTKSLLSGASFRKSELTEADFSNCVLNKVSFRQSAMRECVLGGAKGEQVDFAGADLTAARAAGGCELPQASFHQTRAPESNWSGANLTGGDFSFAVMPGAFFLEASLAGANLHAAQLRQARFGKSKLERARLDQADLLQAAFDHCDLTGADFSEANAFEADFFEAQHEDAVWRGTNLKQTRMS